MKATVTRRASGLLTLALSAFPFTCGAQVGHPVVLLDAWFDSQQRAAPNGQMVYAHYKWSDTTDTGFSLLGEVFRDEGARTRTLAAAPTAIALAAAQLYMVVAPDTTAANPHAHRMTAADASTVAAWVHHGGVLLLMANDPAHADIPGLDVLADRFGLHFNDVLAHHVEGRDLDEGRVRIPAGTSVFRDPYTLFLNDTCSLTLSGDARPVAGADGAVLMARARFGRGTVFAVADPWLYNEYTNGRNLPASFDNLGAARALVRWLLAQVPQQRAGEPKPAERR